MRRCARCCEAPSIRANAVVWHLRTPRAAFLWWQRVVNGFELQEARRAERTFVFRCTHFELGDPALRQLRDAPGHLPGLSPRAPRPALPELLPGCGYRAVTPGARRMLTVLDQQPLTEEQRARLKRDLRLE